jgi:hypothetical protein
MNVQNQYDLASVDKVAIEREVLPERPPEKPRRVRLPSCQRAQRAAGIAVAARRR